MTIIYLIIFLCWNCSVVDVHNDQNNEIYFIKKEDRKILIDGFINKDEWPEVDSIAGLYAPWNSLNHDKTIFKAFQTDQYLFFYFKVEDIDIVTLDFTKELTVADEDRVELFFSPPPPMKKYYCLEIDPLGRVLDYSATYYRKFNEEWDFKNIKVETQITQKGYVVEGCLSIKELKRIGIKKSFYLGVFRADFNDDQKKEVIWYSWINPENPTADFHIPSALGKCNLEDP